MTILSILMTRRSLEKHKHNWEDLAELDPLWAILSFSEYRFGKWDTGQFFKTGDEEISKVMEACLQLGYPKGTECVLDFGCGVGRCTRALAKYFKECYGVDISENMIAKANELNSSISNCTFTVNYDEDLRIFSDDYFDMIYTTAVLQHIPSTLLIRNYISEFLRTLKAGGILVFQLPHSIPLLYKAGLGSRIYNILRTLGFNKQFIYQKLGKLGLIPYRMNFIAENEVVAFLTRIGGKVLEVKNDSALGPSEQSRTYYPSRTYYVTKSV
jgi:ubiquinone/menaquinone biosynthesis C-methylase UbiE